jgi:hypothetical protein
MAAGLLLEDDALTKYWENCRKRNSDAARIESAVKRFGAEVLPRLDKEPEFGGSAKDELYQQAVNASDPKKAVEACTVLLQSNPRHLRALVLKRQALAKIQ